MGNIVENYAFNNVKPSYDEKISYLTFVKRKVIGSSYEIEHCIPVRFYFIDANYPTFLISHGNSEDIGRYDLDRMGKKFKANICIYDYAGYGMHSEKYSSEIACKKDICAVYNFLTHKIKINPEKIIIYGYSLGSGPACYLAYRLREKKSRPKKLILVAPFLSAVKSVTKLYSPFDIFSNYLIAPDINISTLILHGDQDQIIPYESGFELSKRFPNLHKFCTLSGSGHCNILTQTYYNEIDEFISS